MGIAAELDSRIISTRQRLGTARLDFVIFTLLVAVSLFLALRSFDSYQFGYTQDSVDYTLHAVNLIDDSTAQHVVSTGARDDRSFPFGYPMLLTPLVVWLPQYDHAPQILSVIATILNAALLFWGWRVLMPGWSNVWRYVITGMTVLAPTTIMQSVLNLSEAVFTTAFLLAVILAICVVAEPTNRRLWFALCVACFFLVLTRTVGLVPFAAILLYLGVALRGRALRGFVVLFLGLVLLTGIVVILKPETLSDVLPVRYITGYVHSIHILPPPSQPSNTPPQIARLNTFELAQHWVLRHIQDLRTTVLLVGGGLTDSVSENLGTPWLIALPNLILAALLGLGNFLWIRRTRTGSARFISLFQFSGLSYLLVILVWDGTGTRLLYPIQPQIFFAVLLAGLLCLQFGARVLSAAAHSVAVKRVVQTLPAAIAVLFVVGWFGLALYRDWTLRSSYDMWGDLNQRTEWIRANIPPDAILVSDWAQFDYLETGHDTAWLPIASSAADLYARLSQLNGRYLVLAVNSTFTEQGASVEGTRAKESFPFVQALVGDGKLVPVYSNNFPLQVWRIEP